MSLRFITLYTRAQKAACAAAADALKTATDAELEEIVAMTRYEECPDMVCDAAMDKLHARRKLRAEGKLTKRGRI